MPNVEVILGLILAVAVLSALARQVGIAYPILLVIGGLVLSFIPGVPNVALPPDLVLILFLPPLLYWESLNLSYRDLRFSIRPILSLAVGLVLVTIGTVAVVAHLLIPGFTWALAFVLGTIVGPTDEVAVSAIAERLPLPARLVALIEDESLLNDGSSLVAYNVAVAAVVTGTFSLMVTGLQVLAAGIGGIAIGLAAGWLVLQLRKLLDDPLEENTISLLTGFAAYLPANALHLSGVLAVVACGIYLSRAGPRVVSPRTRLQNRQVWEIVTFLLNGVLFVLVGLQLHSILGKLSKYQPGRLLLYALLIVLVVIGVRIVWVFSLTYLPRLLSSRFSDGRRTSWQEAAIVAWAGMRGAVSLAAALAVPFVINGGGPFPHRELIIYLTFAVILSTLVLQGLTLPLMIQRLRIAPDRKEKSEEEAARLAATQAALERLNSATADGLPAGLIDGLRTQLQQSNRKFLERKNRENQSPAQRAQRLRYRRLLLEVLDAERDAVVDLRDQGIISDDVMHIVERELDLDEIRFEPDGRDGLR